MKIKKSITISDCYKPYKKQGGTLSKTEFRLIAERFYKTVSDMIIDGGVFYLGKGLGLICIKRFEKIYEIDENGIVKNGTVDWITSKKYKQELIDAGKPLWNNETKTGNKYIIYYDHKWNYRWAWIKKYHHCIIKNNTIYSFSPTNDNTMRKGIVCRLGNKGKLKKALKDNPLQYLKYIRTSKIK